MIELQKKESIYHIIMDAGENRWNTTFVREFSKALDEVEKDDGPGALITSSTDPKFFSNGLDLNWMESPQDHPDGGDREVFGEENLVRSLLSTYANGEGSSLNKFPPRVSFISQMSSQEELPQRSYGETVFSHLEGLYGLSPFP